ncbi:MAG: hypothetical protein ACREDV_03465, partial [Methylocella sp.]
MHRLASLAGHVGQFLARCCGMTILYRRLRLNLWGCPRPCHDQIGADLRNCCVYEDKAAGRK